MGCVQSRPSPPSGTSGLDKMKLRNGYVPAPVPRTSRPSASGKNPDLVPRKSMNGTGVQRVRSAGIITERYDMKEPPVAVEETVVLVGGWPKWLADNVPREVLAGLVPRSADTYVKLDKVGQGTYSNVYKARDRDTGKIVALKKVRFDTSETESIRFMAREIMILQKLDHPNIIKLEGLATSRMQYSIYLVFEFMHSDLATVISRPEGRLTEPQVKCYMQQLLSGLRHCHEKGILHRDIKGSNLLIDKQGVLKIADFGLANYFNPNKKRPLTSRVVTLWYRSPELLLGSTDYGVGIDLWSAGCLLAEMFAGRPIMPGKTEVEQLHRIFKLCGSPPEDYWRRLKLSTSFRPPQPYRPLITEAFKDFPSCSLGLLKTLLALDPSRRGSASSALQNEFFSTSPLACDLSGLPVVYKKEDDESNQPHERRKRKSAKLKHQSRAQKEAPVNVEQDIMKLEVGDYGRPIKAGVHTTYSHELMRSTTGSTSSGMQPQRYSLSTPPPLPPVKSPPSRESVVVQSAHCHELGSSSATGSTSSSPPPIKPSSILEQRTEARPAATKNVKNGPRNHRYGMEKRSVSTSGFRRFDGKQILGDEFSP